MWNNILIKYLKKNFQEMESDLQKALCTLKWYTKVPESSFFTDN